MASSALVNRAALGSAHAFGSRSIAYHPSNTQVALPARRASRYGSSGSSLLAVKTSSAFLDGGASSQALAVPAAGVQEEHRSRGGALVVEANLFGRIVRIVKSYANAVVSSAEDPEKLLDQTVIEMGEDLAKMRQASAQVLASQKQLEQRYKQAQSNADDWLRRAKLALQKDQEELAKEALKKKKDYEDNAAALKAQLDAQKGVVDKLISNTRLLESKISEAKSKKDTLKARAASAKTSKQIQGMIGSLNTSNAVVAFDKMEEKVLSMEAEAESTALLVGGDKLENKFAALEAGSVEDELAMLKKGMIKGSSVPVGALPEGRPIKDALDLELEELRRKARE